MVQISRLTVNTFGKPFQDIVRLPVTPLNVLPEDNVDLDFSDVFGPLPTQAPENVTCDGPKSILVSSVASEFVYDNPAVICRRSHSLVGPSNFGSEALKLSQLMLHENEESVDFAEGASVEAEEKLKELSHETAVLKKDIEDNGVFLKAIGIDDFEVLKVVGQGAFAKVYQVKKIGTADIFAMKVMRKDKIVEKNHAEYMNAEREILTKVDHPFVVQLRYSFQVMTSTFCFCL